MCNSPFFPCQFHDRPVNHLKSFWDFFFAFSTFLVAIFGHLGPFGVILETPVWPIFGPFAHLNPPMGRHPRAQGTPHPAVVERKPGAAATAGGAPRRAVPPLHRSPGAVVRQPCRAAGPADGPGPGLCVSVTMEFINPLPFPFFSYLFLIVLNIFFNFF